MATLNNDEKARLAAQVKADLKAKKKAAATAKKLSAQAAKDKAEATALKAKKLQQKKSAEVIAASKRKSDREAAAARVASQKANAEKARLEFEAKKLEEKDSYIRFAGTVHDSIKFQHDDAGITSSEIARLFLVGTMAVKVMLEQVSLLPVKMAVDRLNEAYISLLDDDMKVSFKKKISNATVPSSVGKRYTMDNLVSKIGFQKGKFTDISDVDTSDKQTAGKKGAQTQKQNKPEVKPSNVPVVINEDEDKSKSQLDTTVDITPRPSGTDAQNRLVAKMVVTAADTLDVKHLTMLIGELNKLLDERVKLAA